MTRPSTTRFLWLVVAALLWTTGCSDAHTPEEKALADDGIDPRIVTVFYAPRFAKAVDAMLTDYEDRNVGVRFVPVPIDESEAAARIRVNPGPSVWIGDPVRLDAGGEGGEPAAVLELGGDPLAVAWRATSLGLDMPDLDEFASGDLVTATCTLDTSCGRSVTEALAEAGVDAHPDQSYEDDRALLDAFFLDETTPPDLAVMRRSYATSGFPRLASARFPDQGGDLLPIEARRYGSSPEADAVFDWLGDDPNSARARELLDLEPLTDPQ